jgi:prolyl-tRNA synthetase
VVRNFGLLNCMPLNKNIVRFCIMTLALFTARPSSVVSFSFLQSSRAAAGLGLRVPSVGRSRSSSSLRRSSSSIRRSSASIMGRNMSSKDEDLEALITAKGFEVRDLKVNVGIGVSKDEVSKRVGELLELKVRRLTHTDANVSAKAASKTVKTEFTTTTPPTPATSAPPPPTFVITPRHIDYNKWYSDLILHGKLAESSPVRGCMIIKPWGMSIWDAIKKDLDYRITEEHDVENAYFPLLIPQSFLSKEAAHVEGFATECAVVTHHRLKTASAEEQHNEQQLLASSSSSSSGDGAAPVIVVDEDSKLDEPLIIRPTSETMIWHMFGKWINSYRDLPLKINQWANVMRWEMRTRPFLRSSEFLWQEGHTAHSTAAGAQEDAVKMINEYSSFCEDALAMPVICGVKSSLERFAGATETYTIEALMQNGWALQSGTSHDLGQNFAKAFNVNFQTSDGLSQEFVYGSSWGVSTRLIGALIMTHSDDEGLVLPPKVAPKQVVIVPIPAKKNDVEGAAALEEALKRLKAQLKAQAIRFVIDDRDYIRSGAKVNTNHIH